MGYNGPAPIGSKPLPSASPPPPKYAREPQASKLEERKASDWSLWKAIGWLVLLGS